MINCLSDILQDNSTRLQRNIKSKKQMSFNVFLKIIFCFFLTLYWPCINGQCETYTITANIPTSNIYGVNCITGANVNLYPGGLCNGCSAQVCAVNGTISGSGINANYIGECLDNFTAIINSNTTNICTGYPVEIYINSSSGFTYQWYKNGTPILGAISAVFYATEAGNYYCRKCNNWYSQQCKNSNTITLVSSSPVMTNANSINVCSGEILNFPLSSNIPSSYSWIAAENQNIGGENINTTNSSAIIDTLENYTTLSQTLIYTVTPVANGCTGNSQLVTVNVKPKPALLNISDGQICSESNLNIPLTSNFPSIFNWSTSNNQNVALGSPSAGSNSNINTVLINNTNENLFVPFVITPSANGCVGSSVNLIVVVFPLPEVSISPTLTTFCDGGSVELLANSTSTVSYQWKLNSNVIPNANNSVLISYNSGEYQVTVLDLNGCLNQSNIASVSSVPDPFISSQPLTEQTICVGGIPNPVSVSVSGGIGTTTYQWYTSGSLNTPIPSANSATYAPAMFNTTSAINYYASISFSGSGCNSLTTALSQVNVVNDPTIATVDPNDPIIVKVCMPNNPACNLGAFASGGSELHYQWFVNNINSQFNGTAIANANTANFSPSTNSLGDTFYYCEVTSTVSGCTSPLNTGVMQITTIEQPQIFTEAYPIGSCLNNAIPPIEISGNYDDIAHIKFCKSNIPQVYLGPEISSTEFIPESNIPGFFTYYFIYDIDYLNYYGCINDTSDFYEVTITDIPQLALQSTDDIIGCSGAEFNLANLVQSNLQENYSIIWSVDNTIADTIHNSTNYQTLPISAGSHQIQAEIISSFDNCTVSDSVMLNLNVAPTPYIVEELNFDQNICPYDTEINLPSVILSNDYSFITPIFEWFDSSDNTITPIAFANTNSYLPPIQNNSNYQSFCQINFGLPGCPTLETSISEISIDYMNDQCFPFLNIPEAISPNNDGMNDFWTIPGIEQFNGYKINVFNSFGQSIYFVQNSPPNWDGMWNGQTLPNGDYFYSVKLIELNRTIFGTVSIAK